MSRFLCFIQKSAASVKLDSVECLFLFLLIPLATSRAVYPADLPPYSPPSVTPTQMPTAFTAEWGNYFISTSSYAYEQWNSTDIFVDGGVNIGAGLGNSRSTVAVEVGYNIESFRGIPEGGSVDLKIGRSIVNRPHFKAAIGGGLLRAFTHGKLSTEPKSAYGVLTMAWPLRPDDPSFRQTFQVSLGAGSGRFQRIDQGWLPSQGVVASFGLELAPNVAISAGWVGRGVNSTLSVVPARGIPLFLSLSGVNLDNSSGAGRAGVLSLTWGGSFRTATF